MHFRFAITHSQINIFIYSSGRRAAGATSSFSASAKVDAIKKKHIYLFSSLLSSLSHPSWHTRIPKTMCNRRCGHSRPLLDKTHSRQQEEWDVKWRKYSRTYAFHDAGNEFTMLFSLSCSASLLHTFVHLQEYTIYYSAYT